MYNTTILDRASLSYIINLLQRDTECMDDNEQDYQMMQQDLLVETERFLRDKLSEKDVNMIIGNMRDYATAREGEALQIGVKAGLKLMKELTQL